jgi:hypothetical protein
MAFVAQQPIEARPALGAPMIAAWSLVGAFGVYFCAYVFRKPFTAALFAGGTVWGLEEKAVLVIAQTLGYASAKVLGVRVIAETPPERRAVAILALIGLAEAALFLFGLAPSPLHVLCLFVNGLSLGMVFGMVIGFLEGRRTTEALAAGLCASFILADGFAKSIGTWLLDHGVSERWMPGVAGLIFLPPLLAFLAILARTPPPDDRDVASRGERPAMDRGDRAAMVRCHGFGLAMIVAAYVLVTLARGLRADFAPKVWRGLGVDAAPSTFANSEILVALLVLVANGLSVLILDNRRALFTSIGVAIAGGLLMLASLAGLRLGLLDGFAFMVLLGTGLYLPYVAIHTTIFERLIAMTRDRGNLGFLMYVADSAGYLGYAALMLAKGFLPTGESFMGVFTATCGIVAALTCASLAASFGYFASRGGPRAQGRAET